MSKLTIIAKWLGGIITAAGGMQGVQSLVDEKIKGVAKSVLGSSTAAAQKDTIDEDYMEIVCQKGTWSKDNITQIEKFRDHLYENNPSSSHSGKDEKHAFTLTVAHMVLTASESFTTTLSNSTNKPRITQDGIDIADAWLKRLFSAHKTFTTRRTAIRNFGSFQLIEEKKIGKLQQSLKDGWLATGKDGFLNFAKGLPKKNKAAIIAIYNHGCAIATSEVVTGTITATVEETVNTVKFGTKTVSQIITTFTLVFCLILSLLSYSNGWLWPFICFSLMTITLCILTLVKKLKKSQLNTTPQEG